MNTQLEHSFANSLNGFFTDEKPATAPAPELVYFNDKLAERLNLYGSPASNADRANVFSGNALPGSARPIAQVYAGHQFGRFNPQLGDGRALIIGEIIDSDEQRLDVCLKGSGQTTFSRGGDGLAALGPMLREVLISEALNTLEIPTTRSLAVVATGNAVYRDTKLPGAVLTRIASSHIRIGTFEYFAARSEHDQVRRLADYCIARHDPDLVDNPDKYLEFYRRVTERQALLIAKWMSVGFIHGVMNTDNMTISGETIDFGPCAFIEAYNPEAVFSSIDHNGRYAYKNQPAIAQWNLARLAECLLPLLHEDTEQAVNLATEIVESFDKMYEAYWLDAFRIKLGLDESVDPDSDKQLINRFLDLLEVHQIDFTSAFYALNEAFDKNETALIALFESTDNIRPWLEDWQNRVDAQHRPDQQTADAMRLANPRLIARNHRVEEALSAASEQGDITQFEHLLVALQQPASRSPEFDELASAGTLEFTRNYQTFCGT